MTKKDVEEYEPGTPEHVIAHARYKAQRGRGPSLAFAGIINSRLALAAAHRCLEETTELKQRNWWTAINRLEISRISKALLREAVKAWRKGLECPVVTKDQFIELILAVGIVQLNGDRLLPKMTDGRLTMVLI